MQCRCGFVENPSPRNDKCHGCERQLQTKGKRLDGIIPPMLHCDMQGNSTIHKEVIRQCGWSR